jgi:hypothetical protein
MLLFCLPFCFKNWPNFFFFWFVFRDRVSLCSPGCPGAHFVDQAGLELRNPPASASQVLGLKACTTTPGKTSLIIFIKFPKSSPLCCPVKVCVCVCVCVCVVCSFPSAAAYETLGQLSCSHTFRAGSLCHQGQLHCVAQVRHRAPCPKL